jgi:single-strand DNA-binding protein
LPEEGSVSFNKITLVGNLGRDPELRYTPQGTPVCSFSMATTERRKDREGAYQETTTWWRVTLWGRMGETASEHLKQGQQVYIEGRVRVNEYTSRDGKQRYTLEVHATDMQFISSSRPKDEAAEQKPAAANFQPGAQPAPDDNDVPF